MLCRFLTAYALSGLCLCLAQQPGDILWSVTLDDLIYSSPAVADDGTIYIGTEETVEGSQGELITDGRLYALNPDGTQKWVFNGATDWIDSSPAIGPDGTIYAGSWDNRLYALDPEDGSQLWSYETGGLILASPAIGQDGTIYFGSSDFVFYALNPDGTVKWEFLTPGELDSSPAVAADGAIYFGSYDGRLYALNPDGTLKWSYQTAPVLDENMQVVANGNRIASSPAIDIDGNIYFGSGNGNFYALTPEDGNLLWPDGAFNTGGKVDSSPAIDVDGAIYFASRDDILYALDADGFLIFFAEVGDIFYSSSAVDSEGNIYIVAFAGGNQSTMYCYNPAVSLFPLWSQTIPAVVDSSPTIAPNGVIYVGGYDGKLYAIQGGNPLSNGNWPQFSRDAKHTGALADKALPFISWQNPDDILVGAPLDGTQLNATANVPGTFDYDPDFGAVLDAGLGQALSLTFTPDDLQTYLATTVEVTLNVLTYQQYWLKENFTEQEQSQPSLVNDDVDFENDGIVNLLEYAFNLDPKVPDTDMLPAPFVGPGNVLAIEFVRDTRAVDLTYRVEVGSGLNIWAVIAEGAGGNPLTGAGTISETSGSPTRIVTVSDTVPLDQAGLRFMRVLVLRNESN